MTHTNHVNAGVLDESCDAQDVSKWEIVYISKSAHSVPLAEGDIQQGTKWKPLKHYVIIANDVTTSDDCRDPGNRSDVINRSMTR